jgi:DNA modification methylase
MTQILANTATASANTQVSGLGLNLWEFVPREILPLHNTQTDIPRIAKDDRLIRLIDEAVRRIPTTHTLQRGDARRMGGLGSETVHLVVTSPPYWILKQYRDSAGQMGHIEGYEQFLSELDKVWAHCFRCLVPEGRLICVVGDVCLSRRKNQGRHTVVPLHASIQEHCRKIGFDNLAPIIWRKIANAVYEVENGSGFLGKPSEPNSVIKNDIEFILMERKPGDRTPDSALITKRKKDEWDLLRLAEAYPVLKAQLPSELSEILS